MRDVNRIPVLLNKLQELWMSKREQDLRFGQMVCYLSNECDLDDIFNKEDDEWLKIMEELIEKKKLFNTDNF